MTCGDHSGIQWFIPTAWLKAGITEAPCFLCDPEWWDEHEPPSQGLAEVPSPEFVADIVGEMVSSGHWPPREDNEVA